MVDLKRKAQTLDYGSHDYVSNVHKKSLVDRKREEWNRYKQNEEYENRVKEFEEK